MPVRAHPRRPQGPEWLVVEQLRAQEVVKELHCISDVMKGTDLFEATLSEFQWEISFGVSHGMTRRRN